METNPYIDTTPPESPDDTGARKRWYDEDIDASNALEWLLAFPKVALLSVAKALGEITEQQHQQLEDDSTVKSLGAEGVTSLYQSRLKRRSSDKQAEVFRFFTRLKALPTKQRNHILTHSINIITGVRLYLKACIDNNATPKATDLRKITDEYRRRGQQGLANTLKELEISLHLPSQPIAPTLPAEPEPPKPEPKSSGSGMQSRR